MRKVACLVAVLFLVICLSGVVSSYERISLEGHDVLELDYTYSYPDISRLDAEFDFSYSDARFILDTTDILGYPIEIDSTTGGYTTKIYPIRPRLSFGKLTNYGNKNYSGKVSGQIIHRDYDSSSYDDIIYFDIEGRLDTPYNYDKDEVVDINFEGHVYVDNDGDFNIANYYLTGMLNENERRIDDLEISESSQNSKISNLETWKQTIDTWKSGVTTAISDIWDALFDHEDDIEELQDMNYTVDCTSTCGDSNETFPQYLSYLGSSDRKKIVCGYAEDERMDNIVDLGYNCTLTYKTYSSGRERVRCRCKKL